MDKHFKVDSILQSGRYYLLVKLECGHTIKISKAAVKKCGPTAKFLCMLCSIKN